MRNYLPKIILVTILVGCSTLQITNFDLSWPLENVLKVSENGEISDKRYSLRLNVSPILDDEFKSLDHSVDSIRVIRDEKGYYYLTAEGFKNVYVFENGNGELKLVNKFLVLENGLNNPAFNQRKPYIMLLFNNSKSLYMKHDGVKSE